MVQRLCTELYQVFNLIGMAISWQATELHICHAITNTISFEF